MNASLKFTMLSLSCLLLTYQSYGQHTSFKFGLQERFEPKNEKALRAEIPQIIAAQQNLKEADLWAIKYWNSASHAGKS
ncbi:MAG: hypothetical protein AAF740_10950 [Bacteroidota bacterium]